MMFRYSGPVAPADGQRLRRPAGRWPTSWRVS